MVSNDDNPVSVCEEKSLHITVMSTPNIQYQDRPLKIQRAQVRALLYLLASSTNCLPREAIIALFWPDKIERSSVYLSHLITHLRNALPDRRMLNNHSEGLCLNHEMVSSDYFMFDALLSSKAYNGEITALQQAVALYDGGFLVGFSLSGNLAFDLWVGQKGYAIEAKYLTAKTHLIDFQIEAGDYYNAITNANNYLEIDPLNEVIHRKLILLYHRVQLPNLARQQYMTCKQLLQTELGLDPQPETDAAFNLVISNGKEQATPEPHSFTDQPADRWLPPATGQEKIRKLLTGYYNTPQNHHGCTVFVSGEHGLGKTRLLQDTWSTFKGRKLFVSFPAHEQSTPSLYAITKAVADYLARENLLVNLPPDLRAAVAWMMPETGELPSGKISKIAEVPGLVTTRFQVALSQILQHIAQQGGLLLCLDDLDMADKETLHLVQSLAMTTSSTPLLILGSYCCKSTGSFDEFKRGLRLQAPVQEIALEWLKTRHIAELMKQWQPDLSHLVHLSQRVHDFTGGNPLFVIEVLRLLANSATPIRKLANVQDILTAKPILYAIDSRIGCLDSTTLNVLRAAAVTGNGSSFTTISRMVDYTDTEILDALDTLVDRQFLAEMGLEYVFRHELIQQHVLQQMSASRREVLKQRINAAP